jgi:hypothetical protein
MVQNIKTLDQISKKIVILEDGKELILQDK